MDRFLTLTRYLSSLFRRVLDDEDGKAAQQIEKKTGQVL